MKPMNYKELVLRPCEVENIGKALFHLWEQYSKPIPAGVTIGSYPAGIVSYTVGIVEDSNGQIHRVPPEEIRFLGDIMREYDFGEENSDLVYPFMAGTCFMFDSPLRFYEYAISIDYGTVNPCSAGIWGHNKKHWYRISEYYFDSRKEGYQRTDKEHFGEICRLIGDKRIKAFVIDPSAASFIEFVKRDGRLPVVVAVDNIEKGISQVESAIKSGEIRICRCCRNAIREFNEYKMDSLTHKPIRENDHAMDDIRYFVSVMEKLK